MPGLSALVIALMVLVAVIAAAVGWFVSGVRSKREKHALNSNWRQQLEALQSDCERLQAQNSSLTQQVGQYQASHKDSRNRAQELAASLRDAMSRRDALQRQVKDIRNNLEKALSQRNDLRSDADNVLERRQETAGAVRDRDERIARLKRELANWHSRVPPLVAQFRARDREARELREELGRLQARLADHESRYDTNDTRIEPMDGMPAELTASNDQYDEPAVHELFGANDRASEGSAADEPADGDAGLPERSIAPRDDLKRIKGIGPAIERALNELGIYRYDQMADLNERDVARIAERLRGFSGRIQRDDWIGQARLLHYEKSCHPS